MSENGEDEHDNTKHDKSMSNTHRFPSGGGLGPCLRRRAKGRGRKSQTTNDDSGEHHGIYVLGLFVLVDDAVFTDGR
eukprot:scaffold528_cov165-Amphora_coffeaeformis.AAC.51